MRDFSNSLTGYVILTEYTLFIINESHTFFVEKNHPMINALFLLAAAKHPLDKLAKLITLLKGLQNLPSTESGYKNGHQLDPRLTHALSYIPKPPQDASFSWN
ncbi:hypothetical protein ADS77_05080 [Pseudoalteromonas porphyrae]|uniref:Uncharacterized protein n=1 Tax=Pseudoalteromonas porphyrae TaxID=187330 RepID=A0A0N1EWL1_9GAMM|nr:hypothetical protein ADS77_05080 [Pseudoalteromonas porphyrae]